MSDAILEIVDKIVPPLKWAGGKRWLIEKHGNFLDVKFDRYIEPFFGSGAVFFHLKPKNAIVSDSNTELMDTYLAIKMNWKIVVKRLERHKEKHSFEYYYNVRSEKPIGIYARAARLLYLNRTCWNALYRVNRKGKFNVPKGTKDSVFLDTDNFALVSACLANTTIQKKDFKDVLVKAKSGDLVFIDPPYTISHNNNGFIKYNEKIFSWEDQIALSKLVLAAKRRGAKILLTNAWHVPIRKLYEKHFRWRKVTRVSTMAADSESRGIANELLVFN